ASAAASLALVFQASFSRGHYERPGGSSPSHATTRYRETTTTFNEFFVDPPTPLTRCLASGV
ncbi:MAG: hypothetical protein WBQ02_07260, partial [Terracidiphilus sp.]